MATVTTDSCSLSKSCSLSIDDFNDVSLSCQSVSPQWATLAKHLKVGVRIVESIEVLRGGRDTEWCLDELLKAWLRQTSTAQPSPTWRILCDAIANIDRPLSNKILTDHAEGCNLCSPDESRKTKRPREKEQQVDVKKRKKDQWWKKSVEKNKNVPLEHLNKELCDAAEIGDTDRIEILAESGAYINTRSTKQDSLRQTPLHIASSKGQSKAVDLLISLRAIVNAKDDEGNTPLHYASMKGHSNVVNILLSHGATVNEKDNEGSTPLHNASFNGHKDVVNMLQSHGATVNEKDNGGSTPLHIASSNEQSNIVNLLLSLGATLNEENIRGNTPLHSASRNTNSDTVNVLLSHGAIVDSVNKNHQTPLHKCFARINYCDNITATAKSLISYGADLYHEDKNGNSPIMIATVLGFKDLMLSHGVSEDIISKYRLPSGWEATWNFDVDCIQYTNTVTGVKQKTHPSLSDSTH